MSNLAVVKKADAIESALMMNDLSKLSTDDRLKYYNSVCDSVGLNPLTQPFAYINLNGKLTLYAKRDAADQLRKIHGVSISIKSKEMISDLFIVHVEAKDKTGKYDEATGIVPVAGLKGADLANAMLKAETKAKRRVTLSICGLGLTDESELETIDKSAIKPAENPQIANPLKKVEPIVEPVQQSKAEEVFTDHDFGGYVCKGGKFKEQALKDLDMFELDNYLQWIKGQVAQGKTLHPNMQELVENAEAYLATLDVSSGELK